MTVNLIESFPDQLHIASGHHGGSQTNKPVKCDESV